MKQRKFRKLFWCWNLAWPSDGLTTSFFMRAHKRKVKL
jgi:hypothetical protein